MTTDARASRQFSEGLSLLIDGMQKIRLAVEIERTLHGTSEPDGAGKDTARLSPCARNGQGRSDGIQ